MTMTNEEIVREYRQAAHPAQQIRILADLNECKKKAIVEILREAGCELPSYYNKQPKPPQPEPEPEPAAADAAADAEYVKVADILPVMIRAAAIETIASMLRVSDKVDSDSVDFKEQVRGVLALVHEVEQRCEDRNDSQE